MTKNPLFISLITCALLFSINLFAQDHLLLTEAVVTPTTDEFIEIYNATGATVDLTNYYLSDDQQYALTPGIFGAGPAPSLFSSDFIVQFPNGAMIAHRQVVVIAFDGANFITTFGFAADYEIFGTDAGTPDMIPIDVGSSAGLTNGGENACLFYWDGVSDLVKDVDMVNIGTPSASNAIGNKTGLAVDGPDADTLTTTYLDDAGTMPLQLSDPGFGFSTKRVKLEDGNELRPVGTGNGITGHDETTEDIYVTWDTTYVAPDPGVVGPEVPVELTSFTVSVSGNSVTLNWVTATELNNSGFEVQRRETDNAWEKIAFIAGNGTTTEERNYSFIDNNLAVGQYSYRIKQIDFDGTSELSDVVNVKVINPVEYALSQNYPNPFNPSTKINFSLPEASNVTLKVFNALGEEVSVLVNRLMEAGTHEVNFEASQLQSGIYFYRLEAGSFNQVRKMTLLK